MGPQSMSNAAYIKATTRHVDWTPSEMEIYESYRGRWINGIIEEVRDGSMVRVEILMDTDGSAIETVMLWLCLSGIQCLRMPKPPKTQRAEYENQKQRAQRERRGPLPEFKEEKANPLAVAAKKFVARRLLHQDVRIKIEHFDTINNKVFGQVQFQNFQKNLDVSAFLLKMGLAMTQEWHMPKDCVDL